ncbi:MAG: hypothetical protein EAZ36_05135 [Verrucomicrobia bacterium]|nr:MAG: hypothetical protein EAZ36_05135 [Verrucomicrobiota bacterium]
MSLLLATLLTGLALLLLGAVLAADTSALRASLRALPRSALAAYVLFGGAAAWFLSRIAVLSEADFGQFRVQLFIAFAVVAVLAFFYVAEFLAVRGLAALVLLAAGPLLDAGFGTYGIALVYKVAIYIALTAAIWLGAQPWRLRDTIDWLQRVPGRARLVGAALGAYGVLLVGLAFVTP